MSDVTAKFFERQSELIASGLGGHELWERMAADTSLPPYFSEREAAEIAGVSSHAMKQRRHRKMEPSYLAVSVRSVSYPRHELCRWLGSMFVDRRDGRACVGEPGARHK